MKTLSFLNMKGGVGKTTAAVNIAAGLSDKGKKVLFVDLDPQANSTYMFCNDVDFEKEISGVLKNEYSLDDAIVKIPINKKHLSIVPSTLTLFFTEAEIRLNPDAPQHNRLKRAIDKSSSVFDYCIIDCPPIVNTLTINAIIVSDLIVVPIKPDMFAVKGFTVTTTNIYTIRDNYEINTDFKILFNIVSKNNQEKQIIEQIQSSLPAGKCFDTQIRNQSKPITYSSNNRQPVIFSKDKTAKVAGDYQTFLKELQKSLV